MINFFSKVTFFDEKGCTAIYIYMLFQEKALFSGIKFTYFAAIAVEFV